jgi:tol-pal system protein YbgF
MPDLRRHHPQSLRAGSLLCVVLPLLTLSPLLAGCDHAGAQTEVPVAQDDPELAQVRRENSLLRDRVANLEERVRMLERGDGWTADRGPDGYERYGSVEVVAEPSWAEDEADSDGPRQLPVVKLTPNGKSIDHRDASQPAAPPPTSAKRGRGSISLSPVPNSGAPDYSEYGGEYVVDARGDAEFGPADEPAPASDGPSGAPASYRLVGSKLVQATKNKPAIGPSNDRDTGVVKDYKAAMALYKNGRYSDAEQAFGVIVSSHPSHDYADNALYWQGEAAYDQAHYADALAAFTKVVERYGGGNKAPDALLKIGLCYGRLGDAANARDVLTQLIAAYPAANASKIAKRKLDDLE